MAIPESVAQVIKVLRKDTILIRTVCPLIQSNVSVYLTPACVWCDEGAESVAVDWVELHADAGRLRLLDYEWMRDDFGRLVADLADLQTGETLTHYLIERGVAKERPHHLLDVLHQMMHAKEPE